MAVMVAEDVVERLRNYDTCNDAAVVEAANEIERLRAEIERLKRERIEASDYRLELTRELERLRRWIFATAVSLAQSGLTLEEYNAITRDVVSGEAPWLNSQSSS